MKKRKLLNLGMVIISIFIVLCGLVTALSIKGWFQEKEALSVSQKKGIVTLERSGLACQMKAGNAIRAGDVLYTNVSSELEISDEEEPFFWLTDNTKLSVEKDEPIAFQVLTGEAFSDTRALEKKVELLFGDAKIAAEQSVLSVSVQSGSSMVCVYSGKISVAGIDEVETVAAGQVLSVVEAADGKKHVTVSDMKASALNDFLMDRLLAAAPDESFCFTEADLQQVKQKRESEKLAAQQAKLLGDSSLTAGKTKEEDLKESDTGEDSEQKEMPSARQRYKKTAQEESTETEAQENKASGEEDSKEETDADSGIALEEETGSDDASREPEEETKTEDLALYCTIEIRCDTILNNMGKLTAGKESYVPADGTILSASKVEFTQGETVFDVLKRVCEITGIQIEYSYTPMYESYYVEGIHQLYEFDCGSESGWMYKVNGWFPNYGCSGYTVKEGDAIVFCYTCNGLGADEGGGNY